VGPGDGDEHATTDDEGAALGEGGKDVGPVMVAATGVQHLAQVRVTVTTSPLTVVFLMRLRDR
jgi:hypothetical protein